MKFGDFGEKVFSDPLALKIKNFGQIIGPQDLENWLYW
jgi:hypothetical protein